MSSIELFLLNLRYKEARLVTVEGNKPLLLNDPRKIWFVYSGAVDVFTAPLRGDRVEGVQRHLFRCNSGEMLVGIAPEEESGLGLRVSGLVGTQLLSIDRSRVIEASQDLGSRDLIIELLERWVSHLAGAVTDRLLPKEYTVLQPNDRIQLDNQAVVPQRGILWAQALEGGLQMFGEEALRWHNGAGHLPISRDLWAMVEPHSDLSVIDTSTFIEQYESWAGLDRFHALVLQALLLYRQEAEVQEDELVRQRLQKQQEVMHQALHQLVSPLRGGSDSDFGLVPGVRRDLLYAACRLVGDTLGVEIQQNPIKAQKLTPGQRLQHIVKESGLQMRQVNLQSPTWWKSDSGPLLAFFRDSARPVALLRAGRGYDLVDPGTRERYPLTSEVNRKLMPLAYCFYRPFPAGPVALRELLTFGLRGGQGDLRAILGLSLLVALLGLIPPVVMGRLFDTVIPQAQTALLIQVGIGLILIALATGVLRIARGFALLRLQTRLDADVQSAVWMRLLTLPIPFFRKYTSGDLGSRAMGVSIIRRVLSGYVITAIFTALFSVTNLVLLFVYSFKLALVALGLILVPLVITVIASHFYLRYERQTAQVQGKVAGTVLQLLTGITKIRIAGAENYAFAQWADEFTQQKQIMYRSRLITTLLTTYNTIWPLITSLTLFAVIAWTDVSATMTTGDFLAFNSAFTQFLMAWTMASGTLTMILPLLPIYQRLEPILTTEPEVQEARQDPGELKGNLDIEHVTFRYEPGAREVLRDVSLSIRPGEFVALVGASGSGKSTLLRLILGFETPESGAVYFDRKNITDLDMTVLRRQVGAVLQNASVMGGSVYANIVGSAPDLTVNDAWHAAQLAGLDADIQAMPMGMHTVISHGGGNLSGGQRQRLLIARALVNRPQILLFDEATSALDNRTQETVKENLEALQVTRVVVAHRLSTIINADRIYVFENGQIVQSGTWDSLMREEGLFAKLARRQMV